MPVLCADNCTNDPALFRQLANTMMQVIKRKLATILKRINIWFVFYVPMCDTADIINGDKDFFPLRLKGRTVGPYLFCLLLYLLLS